MLAGNYDCLCRFTRCKCCSDSVALSCVLYVPRNIAANIVSRVALSCAEPLVASHCRAPYRLSRRIVVRRIGCPVALSCAVSLVASYCRASYRLLRRVAVRRIAYRFECRASRSKRDTRHSIWHLQDSVIVRLYIVPRGPLYMNIPNRRGYGSSVLDRLKLTVW